MKDRPSNSPEHIAIVGGGVIGGFCALELLKAGHRVTIIDQGKFGSGCSHGNCGYVSPSHILPLTQPGIDREALRSLFQPNSALAIRWRWSPALWYWLYRFWRRCNRPDMLEAADGRHQLLQSSKAIYRELVRSGEIECEWTESGLLFVFSRQENLDEFELTNQLLADRFGMSADRFDSKELTEFEPSLSDSVAGAWYYRGDSMLRPDRLMDSLRSTLKKSGCDILDHQQVRSVTSNGSSCEAVSTSEGQSIAADAFVIATGAWTPMLNRQLGCRIPIVPGKGYSLTMERPEWAPLHPMVLEEQRVAITPFRDCFRIGSTMEFAGYDSTIKPARLAYLRAAAGDCLREFAGSKIEETWFGWRPMTWDGKPLIGRTPKLDNVWVAAGHNMLGISMAPGTGRLVRELIDRERPHIDPSHYSLERLSRS